MSRLLVAKIALISAGIMLACETLIGSIAALGIGFEALPISLGLAFVLGFPIYLVGFRSLRWAALSLWVLFLYRWATLCFLLKPSQWTNPFREFNLLESGWMSLLPYSAILVSASLLMLASEQRLGKGSTLRSALGIWR